MSAETSRVRRTIQQPSVLVLCTYLTLTIMQCKQGWPLSSPPSPRKRTLRRPKYRRPHLRASKGFHVQQTVSVSRLRRPVPVLRRQQRLSGCCSRCVLRELIPLSLTRKQQRKREAGQDVMQQKQALLQARAMFNPNQPSAKVVRPAPPGPHPAQPPAKRPRHASNVQTHPTQQGTAQAHPQQQRQQAVEVTIPAAPQHVPPNLPARTGSAARVPVKVLPLPELVQIATPPPSLPPTSTPSDPHVDAPEPASRPLTPTPPRPPPPTLPEPAEDDDPAFRELVQRITAEKLGEMWRQVDNSGLLQCRFCI